MFVFRLWFDDASYRMYAEKIIPTVGRMRKPRSQDVEKVLQLRSRIAHRLTVRKKYVSPLRSLRPCWKAFLNILGLMLINSRLGFAEVETFKFGVAVLEKQLFFPDGTVPMLADNDVGNPLAF